MHSLIVLTTRTLAIVVSGVILTDRTIAGSSIVAHAQFAWGENVGWTNWRDAAAGTLGVRVCSDHLEGWIWSENLGWINVGAGGGPYDNSSGVDFGVNVLPDGYLAGFAWGENSGWLNVGTQPHVGDAGARFDSSTRRFRGYVWGENVGWLNLDDAEHFVAVCIGDLNADGIIDGVDLGVLLGQWASTDAEADLDCDGDVDGVDLAFLLGAWGPCN